MQISVIIATYNRLHLLTKTLPTVIEQDLPTEDYEILVAVDGSTDGTTDYLRSLQPGGTVRVLEQPHRGQAAAINTALKAAIGKLVLFLDDDILCTPALLRAHVDAHRRSSGNLVYGPVLLASEVPQGLTREWAARFCDDFFARLIPENEKYGWYRCMASANSSADRTLLLAMGGLDETFARGNDSEFGVRLWKSGHRFRYEPNAIVHQLFTKTVEEIVQDSRDEGQATVRLCRKHPGCRISISGNRLFVDTVTSRLVTHLVLFPPLCLQLLLRISCWIAERFPHSSFFRKLGLRLMNARLSFESLKGALDVVGSRQALKREFGMRLPVLMYHNIGTATPGSNKALTISPGHFRRQLRWLIRWGYTGITASQWLAWCREARPLPDKPVLISFDDAYADTARHGFRILREEGFTGTVFVVSSEVGGTNTWDQAIGIARQELMTADEIRYWAKHGIEFGAHSRTHADLVGLSPSEVTAEMVDSRDRLAEVVGEPITSFAYPYGYYNDSVLTSAKEAFPIGFTCDAGLNDLRTDLNRLKRAEMVPYSSLFDPFFQVRIGYNPIIVFRRTIGRWRRQAIARARELMRVRESRLFRT